MRSLLTGILSWCRKQKCSAAGVYSHRHPATKKCLGRARVYSCRTIALEMQALAAEGGLRSCEAFWLARPATIYGLILTGMVLARLHKRSPRPVAAFLMLALVAGHFDLFAQSPAGKAPVGLKGAQPSKNVLVKDDDFTPYWL